MPYAAVNGLKMYYEVHGDGPPLLLLHGGTGSIPATWIPYFEPRFRVIAMEQMGHGRTVDAMDRSFHYHRRLALRRPVRTESGKIAPMHVSHAMDKLVALSRYEAATTATRLGLPEPAECPDARRRAGARGTRAGRARDDAGRGSSRTMSNANAPRERDGNEDLLTELPTLALTRATDVVARWGGAEFCVVGPVPGMAPLELERRVRDMVALHLPVEPTCGRSGSAPGERCWRRGTRGRWTRCSARPTRS
jgi:hypothetical protein